MRPEQIAPENRTIRVLACADYQASMRPEQIAPENRLIVRRDRQIHVLLQ